MEYMAFGNDELENCITAKKGDLIECIHCGGAHPIEYGTFDNGMECDMLGFYKCGGKAFLASVAGKFVKGVKHSHK